METTSFKQSVIIGSLKNITDKVQNDLEDKLSLHLFHDIGKEAEILMDIYTIANELQLFDNK